MTHKDEPEYVTIVKLLVLRYDKDWEILEDERQEILKKTIKYLGSTNNIDEFKKELRAICKIGKYQEQALAVAKLLKKWKKQNEEK